MTDFTVIEISTEIAPHGYELDSSDGYRTSNELCIGGNIGATPPDGHHITLRPQWTHYGADGIAIAKNNEKVDCPACDLWTQLNTYLTEHKNAFLFGDDLINEPSFVARHHIETHERAAITYYAGQIFWGCFDIDYMAEKCRKAWSFNPELISKGTTWLDFDRIHPEVQRQMNFLSISLLREHQYIDALGNIIRPSPFWIIPENYPTQ